MRLPSIESILLIFSQNIATKIVPYRAAFGIGEDEVAELNTFNNTMQLRISETESLKTAYHAKVADKAAVRKSITAMLRDWIFRIVNSPNATPAILEELGIDSSEAASDTTYEETPILALNGNIPGRVTIGFRVQQDQSRRACKPDWAKGCVFYRKGKNETQFQIIGYATKSPFIDNIVGPTDEYTYIARYEARRTLQLSSESQPVIVAASGAIAA